MGYVFSHTLSLTPPSSFRDNPSLSARPSRCSRGRKVGIIWLSVLHFWLSQRDLINMSYSFLPLRFTPFPQSLCLQLRVYCVLCIVCCVNHRACIILWIRVIMHLGCYCIIGDKGSEIRLAKLQSDLGLTPFPLFLCPLPVVVTLSK